MDDLRTIIDKTLEQYLNAKQTPFKDNQLANTFDKKTFKTSTLS